MKMGTRKVKNALLAVANPLIFEMKYAFFVLADSGNPVQHKDLNKAGVRRADMSLLNGISAKKTQTYVLGSSVD